MGSKLQGGENMNLETLLSKEEKQIREAIREFTQKEIIPRTKELEADYSLVEEVHQKLVDMGVQSDGYPEEYGGGGHSSMTALGIICEELAKGDNNSWLKPYNFPGKILSAFPEKGA